MADPLSILRRYNVSKKEIITKGDNIIFGEFSWPKTVLTDHLVFGSGKKGQPKYHYTLECLLFLLKHVSLPHPIYVQKATAENIPAVRRPDRKSLLAYLRGQTSTAPGIDKFAPLEIPTQVKREVEDTSDSKTKKPRYDDSDVQEIKEELALHLDDPKKSSIVSNIDRSLSEAMSIEKIAAIKAKRLALKRTMIKEDDDPGLGTDLRSTLEFDIDLTKDDITKERQLRTKTTILQISSKDPDDVSSIAGEEQHVDSKEVTRNDTSAQNGDNMHSDVQKSVLSKIDEACNFMKSFAVQAANRDEYSFFGEHVANRLRKCGRSHYEIAVARHKIEKLIFNLEMDTKKRISSNGATDKQPKSSHSDKY